MRDNDQSSTFCFLIFPAMLCSSVGGGGGAGVKRNNLDVLLSAFA